MKYRVQKDPAETRIQLFESLGFKDHSEFRRLIAEVVEGKPRRVAVDLSELKTVDSAGLGLLVILGEQLKQIGGNFRLLRPTEAVARLLSVVQFEKVCTIEP